MTYADFRQTAETMFHEIPKEFTKGLQGLHILEDAKPEPKYYGVYRLGEYLDPGPDSFLGGNPGLGRHVALYYGSFAALAKNNPSFNWDDELWDTLTHELQHHVESLAGDRSLIEEDRRRTSQFRKRLSK
ncbi:MAG: metallopeptidase family protein [Trueperaceae bacterium]